MVATYVVRQRGWAILQELVFGLEGYRYPLPEVKREPSYMPSACFKHEELSGPAVDRAVKLRRDWIDRHFGDTTRTFSNLVVTASDLRDLLKTIEKDLSLVHAFYYTDDECIGRIADWIVECENHPQTPR